MVAPDAVSEEDIDKLIIPDDLPDEPTFKAYIEAKVYDKEGHIIDYRRQPMKSLTQYFLALMSIPIMGAFQEPPTNQATGILINIFSLPAQQSTYSSNSANISWNWSIQLGSGTQAFSPTLTSLAAPIANGPGVGQLIYGETNVSYVATTIFVSVIVSNYTSETIDVTEIGLQGTIYIQYWNSSNAYTTNSYNFLLSYDTFSTAISIPPNSLATFQIVLSFTG
jgi:hypothetical protein